jgi:hypothetical protein
VGARPAAEWAAEGGLAAAECEAEGGLAAAEWAAEGGLAAAEWAAAEWAAEGLTAAEWEAEGGLAAAEWEAEGGLATATWDGADGGRGVTAGTGTEDSGIASTSRRTAADERPSPSSWSSLRSMIQSGEAASIPDELSCSVTVGRPGAVLSRATTPALEDMRRSRAVGTSTPGTSVHVVDRDGAFLPIRTSNALALPAIVTW